MKTKAKSARQVTISELLDEEIARQQKVINLIASENLPSEAVRNANQLKQLGLCTIPRSDRVPLILASEIKRIEKIVSHR